MDPAYTLTTSLLVKPCSSPEPRHALSRKPWWDFHQAKRALRCKCSSTSLAIHARQPSTHVTLGILIRTKCNDAPRWFGAASNLQPSPSCSSNFYGIPGCLYTADVRLDSHARLPVQKYLQAFVSGLKHQDKKGERVSHGLQCSASTSCVLTSRIEASVHRSSAAGPSHAVTVHGSLVLCVCLPPVRCDMAASSIAYFLRSTILRL